MTDQLQAENAKLRSDLQHCHSRTRLALTSLARIRAQLLDLPRAPVPVDALARLLGEVQACRTQLLAVGEGQP